MNIIAICAYTGSEKLVAMTEDCILQLLGCELPPDTTLRILLVNNKASRPVDLLLLNTFRRGEHYPIEGLDEDVNHGFGVGVNRGIKRMLLGERWPCDHVLVLNNDLQFPKNDWLTLLLREVETSYVLSPRTDVTATAQACYPAAANKNAQLVREVSAFCWLVPMRVIVTIFERWDFPLFPPMFTNYGSDDAAAAIIRGIYGETAFKVVHRSWVKHLKAQTANELHVKAGTEELLKELKAWKRANKLK